jgi:iron complex transport system permease protein
MYRKITAASIHEKYTSSLWVKWVFLVGLAALIVLSCGVIVTLGQVRISISDAYRAMGNGIIPGLFNVNPLVAHVVMRIRLPLIIGAIVAGGGLGICGCVMQAVLKNPMASPFTLGISSGAHFGVSLAAVTGIVIVHGPYFLVGNAFVCALLCSGSILLISTLRGATSETLVLAGIAVNFLFQGAIQALGYIATDEQRAVMSLWGMGSLADLNWKSVYFICLVSLPCVLLLLYKSWDLNIMTVGDESAKSLGVNANSIRIYIMIIASFLIACIVAFVGVIGFAGLIAPHIGRMIIGNNHRFLILASGGIGGALLLIANAISMNLLRSAVVPVSLIMSILGIPLFLYLILKGKKREYWQ